MNGVVLRRRLVSAPTAAFSTEPVAQSQSVQDGGPADTTGNLAPAASPKVDPVYAGVAGTALGLGIGLVVAEVVIPGVVLGALAIGGFAVSRKVTRMIKGRQSR
jgi:hypothetical protein